MWRALKGFVAACLLRLAIRRRPRVVPVAPTPIVAYDRTAAAWPCLDVTPAPPKPRRSRKPIPPADTATREEMLRTAYRVKLVLGRYPASDGGAKAARWKASDQPFAEQYGLEPPHRYFSTFGSLRTAWQLADELADALPRSS